MIKNLFISLFYFQLLIAQLETDKPVSDVLCGKISSAGRWLGSQSSLTENQNKIDITFYDLDLEIDFENEQISGSLKMLGSVIPDQQINFFEIDFTDLMIVDSVTLNGEITSYTHTNNLISIQANHLNNNGGYDFDIVISFRGSPPECGFGSLVFDQHEGQNHVWTLSEPYGARCWWPCKDDPSDKADSIYISVTVPGNQIVASNGLLHSIDTLGHGKKKYQWRELYPIPTYLVSLAIYPYTLWHDQFISANSDTMPIDFYVYPDNYEISRPNFLLVKDMLSVFSDKFGDYPFIEEKYGHANFGWGGGMEHQTITSIGGHSEWLIAHELGHSWWGNKLTCSSFDHIWLNEGFARFSEALWEEEKYGYNRYKEYWLNHAYYGSGSIYVENPNDISTIFNTGLSYNKAGWVVHMLRGVLGDSTFFNVLQTYSSNDSLAYNSVDTEDFQYICEQISGLDLGYFFSQWIYGEGYPIYNISWEQNNIEELIVNIEQVQIGQHFTMPIEILVILSDDSIKHVIENDGSFTSYNLGFIGQNSFNVKLDPDHWILKEVEYLTIGSDLPGPRQLTLFPAFPNPFNSGTNISFFIPDYLGQDKVNINIFDVRGRLVNNIWSGRPSTGYNLFSWQAKTQSSGIYIIELETKDKKLIRKVQLIK